jgi:mono/diheme cytochrome c family protein
MMKKVIGLMLMLLAPSLAHAWPWSRDMMNQISIKPQERPMLFPKRSVPVPGTATAYVPDQDYAAKMPNPIQPTMESINKGKQMFMIYCTPCHGTSGTGNGTVGEKLVLRPFDLTSDMVQALPDGFIFGGAVMPSYANDLSPTERWNVINFVHHGLKPATAQQTGGQTK